MIFIILKQIIIMFLLAAVGYIMFRSGKISNEGSKTIGNILIYLSLPCVIINGFLVERTGERIAALGISTILALIVILLSMALARLFGKGLALDNFAASFSNPGFFGVPIIVSSFGNDAVFYIASFIAFLNLAQWTYGVSLLQNSDEKGMLIKKDPGRGGAGGFGQKAAEILKRLVKAPFMVGIIIGLFFFLTGISMPEIPGKCINFIANLNTPLAMFTIGIYAAQTDLVKMFAHGRMYVISAVKLFLIPLTAMLLMWLLPFGNDDLKLCVLIAAACPVGSNIAVYAQLHNSDYRYAVETIVMSTLLSIISIPVVVFLAKMLWGIA